MDESDRERTLLDIKKALELFPEVLKRKKRAFLHKRSILKKFESVSREVVRLQAKGVPVQAHPWRLCPLGEHWVSEHKVSVKESAKNPSGKTTRSGHCRKNRSKKDQLYRDEMSEIARIHFRNLTRLPAPNPLGARNGNQYDSLIGGWTQYWNDVLKPSETLDPNLVKALISTESDFNSTAKILASKGNWARGLTQLTDQTLKILKDEKGDLKNFLINLDQGDATDPNLNIAAGIRWLFHKKDLLEKKQKKSATWIDAVMEYKGYTRDLQKRDASAIVQRDKFLERLAALSKKNEAK